MRILILILLICSLAISCQAQSGWNYWNISVLYGKQFQPGQKGVLSDFELLIDRGTKSCLSGPNYYGLGVIQRKYSNINELSIKAYFNPFNRYLYRILPGIKLIPHISLEGIKRTEETPGITQANLYIRPSIGFHTIGFHRSIITWKSYLDFGYSSFSGGENILNHFNLTLKVGIGFNPKGISNLREKQKRRAAKNSQ